MSDTIPSKYGSCIRLEYVFSDENGDPEDVSNDTFEIRDATPASLADDFEITLTNPASGEIELFLDTAGAKKMSLGRVNKFRLCRIKADGCEDNANILWIEVE